MKIKTTAKNGKTLAGTYLVTVELTKADIEKLMVGLQEYTARPTSGTVKQWLKNAIEFDADNMTGGW